MYPGAPAPGGKAGSKQPPPMPPPPSGGGQHRRRHHRRPRPRPQQSAPSAAPNTGPAPNAPVPSAPPSSPFVMPAIYATQCVDVTQMGPGDYVATQYVSLCDILCAILYKYTFFVRLIPSDKF